MIDLAEVAEVFEEIANTSSKLEKEHLLVEYADLVGFKEILKFIYNPYIRTGIGAKKLDKGYFALHTPTVEEFLDYYKQTRTGTQDEIDFCLSFIEGQETDSASWLAEGMVTKDLQIGVSVTTLNKVYGSGFIPVIGIMRGMQAPTTLRGFYIATEKIDGNRRIIMNKHTGVEIYTRSGRRDYGLVEIEEQASRLPVGFVYDAELAAVGDYADSIALRQATASIANSKGQRRGAKALIFDMLRQEEYDAGVSKLGALGRKIQLAATFNDAPSIDVLWEFFMSKDRPQVANAVVEWYGDFHNIPQHTPNLLSLPILGVVESHQQALQLAQPIWDTGGEGIMLVDWQSPYEVSPNPRKTLLKIKATQEFSCTCIGVLEGDNKYEGTLGAIEVVYKRRNDPLNYIVKVGSGFADYQRDYYWSNPSKIVGKIVEIESFGESMNASGMYSLNCPIFKRVKGETE